MRAAVLETIERLPESPGVYLMKDARGKTFYIGKAKSLRDRMRAYVSGSDNRAFVALLDRLLADLEVVLTSNEKEAVLLENDLIKEHQPRFNVKLVDDKRFLCLRLDTSQKFPRLQVVRQFGRDKARYFGPYHSAQSIRRTLRVINRHFMLRTCSDQVMRGRKRPCLQYQIGRCPAPCAFALEGDEYTSNVDSVVAFLEGKESELVETLRARMQEASLALAYERAAQVRDQLVAVERSMQRQRIVSSDFVDRDVVGLYREGPAVEIHVMRTRDGRLIDARRFSFSELEVPEAEILADFASRYYDREQAIPEEILFPAAMAWSEPLAAVLSDKRGRGVRVLVPQRGNKRRLVELAERNAHQAFVDKKREQGAAQTAIEKLQRALRLSQLPERIECFDISHLGGKQIVAAAVRFELGVPRRDLYRHYNVRSLDSQDDFAAIYEVLSRRARRGLEEGDLPDLFVIDGGKGQLGAARAALDDHGIDQVELIALAKARDDDNAVRRNERVFVLGHKNPIVLRQDSAELFLLTRARDEAHRFAIGHQKRARRKAATHSELDDIPGVGPKRRKALLETFGSVKRLRRASVEKISQVVGPKVAAAVVATLAKGKT